MSEAPPDAPLDLDRADFGSTPAPLACTLCQQPIHDWYYDITGAVACERCRRQAEWDWNKGSGAGRFLRAGLYGMGAALLGSLLYYAVRAITGYDIGFVAIVVGLLVGGAVRAGSGRRGGWQYQTLAIFLTYASIVSTYIPIIIQFALKQPPPGASTAPSTRPSAATADPVATQAELPKPVSPPASAAGPGERKPSLGAFLLALLALFALAFAIPVLAGFKNIIGLFIIGLGLYEAWKLNRRVAFTVTGPFRVGDGTTSGG